MTIATSPFGTLFDSVLDSLTGALNIQSAREKVSTISGATGTVVHNVANGNIFLHSSLVSDFTANFTNLNLSSLYGTSLVLVLQQGVTAYMPTLTSIGGSLVSVVWVGGAVPSGNSNKIDVVSFSIINTSTGVPSYLVLGQLTTFG